MDYINAFETPLRAHKFTKRFMDWKCPNCECNCRSKWELYASDCAYNHVPVTCKQCKGHFEVTLPTEDTDKYLEGLKRIQGGKDYYTKNLNKNLQKKKAIEKKLKYIPYCVENYRDPDYVYNSDNFESEIIQDWHIACSNIESLKESLEEKQEEEEEYKKEHHAPFHEMILKYYSNPNNIPNTICVNACWVSNTQFAYKCPYCNCEHKHGRWFMGVNERTTHCRMELPDGTQHRNVEITISEDTLYIYR